MVIGLAEPSKLKPACDIVTATAAADALEAVAEKAACVQEEALPWQVARSVACRHTRTHEEYCVETETHLRLKLPARLHVQLRLR